MSGIESPDVIDWPDGIDEQIFLRDYWQKKPLLIRQAFPGFATPLPADELAGLSLEPDTTPRLITQDTSGAYHVEFGPFDEQRFASLTDNNWSLLVTDVDKHVPELACYLDPFRFLPSWRIDDLMVSYAPEGASVGAHVDEYDVFLLQASGLRRWSIDEDKTRNHELLTDAELKLLAAFNPTDTWELVPGDMLYLPPGIGHHGVASSADCTTWSIGFRAPEINALLIRMAELISERMPHQRFTDNAIQKAIPGEITHDAAERFRTLWHEAVDIHADSFASLLGQVLTETVDSPQADSSASQSSGLPDDLSTLQRAAFSRFAWHGTSSDDKESVNLFVDGEAFECTRCFAIDLCTTSAALQTNRHRYTENDLDILQMLQSNGCMYQGVISL